MERSKKLYAAALKKYQNGYINKALEISEECISLNFKNSAAINLKGLLLYLNGELLNARMVWKLNYHMNKDGVAKSYLENSKKDEEREILYKQAIINIKQVNIITAIEILERCAQSDYNTININNCLANCYIKTGKYEEALISVNKVLIIDKKNKVAKENLNVLKKFSGIPIKAGHKPVKYIVSGIIALVFVTYLSSIVLSKIKIIAKPQNLQPQAKTEKSQKTPTVVSQKQEVIFPYEQIKAIINNKDMLLIYNNIKKWKEEQLKPEDRKLISMGQEVLKTEGISYFYRLGSSELSSGNLENAKQALLIAYELGSEDPLYPHIIYTLGNAISKTNDLQSAFKYYEEYLVKYPGGNYEEEVLYKLATLNKNLDDKKSKIYAQKLVDKHPSSNYINSIINWILYQ